MPQCCSLWDAPFPAPSCRSTIRDTDEPAVVVGGQSETFPVGLQSLCREARARRLLAGRGCVTTSTCSTCVLLLRRCLLARLRLACGLRGGVLRTRGRELALEIFNLAFQRGDVTLALGRGLGCFCRLLADLLPCEPADLFLQSICKICHEMSLLPEVRWLNVAPARGDDTIRAFIPPTASTICAYAGERFLPCDTCRHRKITDTSGNDQYGNCP